MRVLFRLLVVFLAALALAPPPAVACGGMTQIDPPSLQLDAGPADLSGFGIPEGDCVIIASVLSTFGAAARGVDVGSGP